MSITMYKGKIDFCEIKSGGVINVISQGKVLILFKIPNLFCNRHPTPKYLYSCIFCYDQTVILGLVGLVPNRYKGNKATVVIIYNILFKQNREQMWVNRAVRKATS